MNSSSQFGLALILIISFHAFLTSCNPQKAETAKIPSVPVTVATAVVKTVPLQLKIIGTVEAYSNISVKAQIGGELMRVHFREGQDVNKGDLLFEIDPRPYQQALNQAQAALARDIAQIRQAQANLARDVAQAKNGEAQAARSAKLVQEGIVSREQNEQVRTSADALQEATHADQAALESARAAANADRAAVEKAKLDLSYCAIRSPIHGRTGNVQLKEGNLIKANSDTPLVVINQITPTHVAFSVPEQKLAGIRRHMAEGQLSVEASLPSGGQPLRGVLTFVDNTADSATGTIRLKATFANKERRLWPGQFVNVLLTLGSDRNVTVVPSEAIQTGQNGQYAFIVKPDHTVENRIVTIGRIADREIIVEKGIQPRETVVTDGQLRLMPGASVEILGNTENRTPQKGEGGQ